MATRFKKEEVPVAPPVVTMPSSWPRASIPEYGPRVVRLTKATRFGVGLLGTLAAGSALVGGLIVTHNAEQGTSLAREGQVVAAQLTSVGPPRKSGESTKYPISYRYNFQGQTITQERNVRRAFYEGLRKGGTMDVTVLPRDPKTHTLGRVTVSDVEKDLAMGALILVALTGLFGGLAWAIRASAQKEARILTDWTATSAQVLDLKKTAGEHGTSYRVKVRYRVPRQAEIETVVKFTRSGKWSVAPGAFLDLLYDPEDVTKVRLREGLVAAEIDPATY